MSLSPVSAIADMVAPVVLITLGTIFANGLLSTGIAVRDRIFALNRERRGILRGPHGEMLDEDSVPPSDRERLTEIREEVPMMLRRVGRIRNAVLIIWITVGCSCSAWLPSQSLSRRARRLSRSRRWPWSSREWPDFSLASPA
jgi:hypothetical protein